MSPSAPHQGSWNLAEEEVEIMEEPEDMEDIKETRASKCNMTQTNTNSQ